MAGWLRSDAERAMFWDQPPADQRHGLGAARFVAQRRPDRLDLIRAALLHDTGKRHARLRILGRVLASLVRLTGRPGRGRIGTYLAHGPLAAGELAAAGAEPAVVEYARDHHGARPDAFPAADWAILEEADRVRR